MEVFSSVNQYIAASIRSNWDSLALTDFQGVSFQYRDVARKIAKLHLLFEHSGLKPGDKVALCGRNSAQWAIVALASLTYGTVAVPILHEFKPDTIHHLINHSESKMAFIDASIWENLDPESMPDLRATLRISDYSLLMSRHESITKAREELNLLFGKRYPERFTKDDVKYFDDKTDQLALINYTSGSTGFSKGVMLSYGNLVSNLQFYIVGLTFLKPGDGMVCMLPLAHMYGFMVEMLHSFIKGCHSYFLTRTPSPKIIMEAFARVRPKLIVTVPLIIEKIIKTRVFPMLKKPMMQVLTHTPVVEKKVMAKIRAKLIDTFGGQLMELIIGGAGLSADVEAFLRKIHFPFTVGYGMTECAPLVSYAPWDQIPAGSCGRVVDRMELRVDSADPENVPGVLHVRGANVMKGYYNNPEATEAAFAPGDGWMNTGDICTIDRNGFLYIRGRDKNMILGPSGQNIYPEEIEQKLNNLPLVNESLVVEKDGKLVALIHPDYDAAKSQGLSEQQIADQMKQNIKTLNQEIPAYSRVSDMRIFEEEFEKTPKRSIKRYLYQ